SFGSHKYDDAEIEQLSNLLSDYSHLAVREQDAATYLSDLIGRQVYQTPDPTLLLRKESWEKIASPSTGIKSNYILVYSLKESPLLKQAVRLAKEKLGLPVVSINQNPISRYHSDYHLRDAGPCDYL